MTAEEIIAKGDYLEHFNPFHNPKNGQFAKKSGGGITSSLSPRGKQVAKRAATAAGVMAGVSAIATVGNAIGAQGALDAMGYGDKLSKVGAITSGVIQAGKVATATALAVVGGHMASDYMKGNKKSSSGKNASKAAKIDRELDQLRKTRDNQAKTGRYVYAQNDLENRIRKLEEKKKKYQ